MKRVYLATTGGSFIRLMRVVLSLLLATSLLVPMAAQASMLTKPANALGLVGYWSFEDKNGSRATDFSGFGHTGTLTNMEAADWVAGKRGRALAFDAATEYVEIANSATLAPTNKFTISAWVKLGTVSDYRTIVAQGEGYTSGWRLITRTLSGEVLFQVGDSSLTALTAVSIPQDVWTHVVGVYNGTQKQLYYNGTLMGQANATYIASSTAKTWIGGTSSGTPYYFNGSLDEVRVYNRDLSATEVADLYAKSAISKFNAAVAGPASESMVLWQTFDGNNVTTSTSTDSSGNGNTGTLTNGPDKVIGRHGQALLFDGTNDYIDLPDSLSGLTGAQSTVSAWIKPTSITGDHFIFDGSTNGSSGNGLSLRIRSDGTVRFWNYSASANANSTGSVTANTWNHVVGTFDGTTSRVYINGVADGTNTGDSANIGGTYEVGHSNTLGGYFNGAIDDVRVYNQALSADQVRQLYTIGAKVNASVGGAHSGNLVAWYTFDGNKLTATTATDSSASGNTGTLTNGPIPALGRVGQAMRFDGSDDRVVTVNNPTGLGYGTGDFSWFAWIYPERVNDSYEMIWAQSGSGIPYFALRDDLLHFYLSATYETSAGYITANTWQHVGIVRSSGTLTLYKNGVAYSSTASQGGSISAPDYAYISSYGSGGAHAFKGVIDDVRIYNKALSASEIETLYNQTK